MLEAFADGVRDEGFIAAVVCGMGGSSLAPDVLAASLPPGDGGIPVRVLDSTDPRRSPHGHGRLGPGGHAVPDRLQVRHHD